MSMRDTCMRFPSTLIVASKTLATTPLAIIKFAQYMEPKSNKTQKLAKTRLIQERSGLIFHEFSNYKSLAARMHRTHSGLFSNTLYAIPHLTTEEAITQGRTNTCGGIVFTEDYGK